MKSKWYFLFSIFSLALSCMPINQDYNSFDEYPVFKQDDLGLKYRTDVCVFKLWSPAAQAVKLRIYENDTIATAAQTIDMTLGRKGVWKTTIKENLTWKYYTYQIQFEDEWLTESPDPYSYACGVNGQRSHIIDLAEAAPINWKKDKGPKVTHPTDMVIYEMHIRDMSIHPDSGIKHKGKFLGLAEQNTHSLDGTPTGLAHLKEIGVTHVHILPAFDFRSLDESLSAEERGYNWGYDPHLYNVPEGTYGTNASDGSVRIREFREMIQALHTAGIGVIMDVVYNHTGATEESVFNQLVPGYYYRQRADGTFSDASACGNETASERPMVRQFIVNSLLHWVKEYHIDGFRFDLMGIHDIETMNLISTTLKKANPNIFLYGEGWTGGDSPLAENKRAVKQNTTQLIDIAVFSDEIRDAIKGHVFTADAKAFISGQEGLEESIKFGVVAGTNHPQINFNKVNYTDAAWSPQPSQCMVYASCHDNHTIWDRLQNSIPDANHSDKIKMQQLALGIVLTSQGVPFLHAGSEFCRTKNGVENSYKSSDQINQIDWNRKRDFESTLDFVKRLIYVRKTHPAFRMRTANDIAQNIEFLNTPYNVVAYTINGAAVGDEWENILVAFNGQGKDVDLPIPQGKWEVVVKGEQVHGGGLGFFEGSLLKLRPYGMIVMYMNEEVIE